MPKLYFAQMDALNDCLVIENLANVGDGDGVVVMVAMLVMLAMMVMVVLVVMVVIIDGSDDGDGGVGGGSLPCH